MRYFRNMKHAHLPEEAAERATAVRAKVAHNFSYELKAQRWSQRAAATALGLTPRYVNSRAIGDVDMSASDLAMFAEFLDVPVARFFDEPHDTDSNVTSINAKKAPKPKLGSLNNSNLRTSDYKVEDSKLATVTHLADRRATKTA